MIINFKGVPDARQSYCDYIDKNLTYHLYLHYHDENKEVFRVKWDGTHYLAYNIWRFSYNAGWSTNKEIWNQRPDLQRVEYSHIPGVYIAKHYCDKEEIIKKIPQLKYVWPDEDTDLWSFIHMIIKYPEMELIYKNEMIRPFWNKETIYRLSKPLKSKLIKTLINNDYPLWCGTNINKILFHIKHPEIKNELEYLAFQNKNWLLKHLPREIDKKYFISRYCARLHDRYDMKRLVDLYKDYLTLMKELKVRENLYPHSIIRAHNSLVKFKEQKNDYRILTKKKYEKLSKAPNSKKYSLYLPQTNSDLVDLGIKFDNCVGSAHYGEDEKKGKCLICAVKTGKIWVACVEIDLKTHKINQIYGKHNTILRSNAPKMFINRYIREVVSNIC